MPAPLKGSRLPHRRERSQPFCKKKPLLPTVGADIIRPKSCHFTVGRGLRPERSEEVLLGYSRRKSFPEGTSKCVRDLSPSVTFGDSSLVRGSLFHPSVICLRKCQLPSRGADYLTAGNGRNRSAKKSPLPTVGADIIRPKNNGWWIIPDIFWHTLCTAEKPSF